MKRPVISCQFFFSSSFSYRLCLSSPIAVSANGKKNGMKETHHSDDTSLPVAPSAIASLAPEILSDIFSFAFPDDKARIHLRTESPLNVSQVSQSWRQLAITTSSLWSQLSFVCADDASSKDHKRNRVMQIYSASTSWDLWIERSKTQPLKITVIQPPDLSREEKDAVRSLMDKTMANFYRWHDIRMEIHDGDYPALVPDFPATLKRLSLMNVDLFPTSLVPATTLWKLQRSERAKVIGKVTLPCLPASRFKDRYQLLGLKDSAVTIDSLRSLELNRESSSELERALRRIILPSLSELAISLNSRYDDSPTGIFPMIQRSNARLKSLRLSYVGIEYSELYDVLRASPTLEELCLTDCTNYPAEDDVISILTIQSHTPEKDILCPRLSNISFSGWHIRNTRDTDRLADMVESRWKFSRSRNQPAVLSVNLTDNPSERFEFSSSRSKALARCISEGLEYTSKGRS